MTSISTGIFKKVAVAKQSGLGTIASAGSSQYLRRVSSSLDLQKQIYTSQELRPDQQIEDSRHGARSSSGTLTGELSPLTYEGFMASTLRGTFGSGGSTSSNTHIAATAATGAAAGYFTRSDSGGSFITDGHKVGDVVRFTGFTTASANNNRNYRITALTSTVMTVGSITSGASGQSEAVVTAAAGDSVTVAAVGKKLITPASSQTNDYWTIEHWFSDVGLSEVFTDVRIAGVNVNIPANAMPTVDFSLLGRDIVTNTSQYFTSPSAVTTGHVTSPISGRLFANGNDYGVITSMSLSISGSFDPGQPVLGSVSIPDIFPGIIVVSGNMTVYFQDSTLRDAFLNETEIGVNVLLTTSTALNSDFVCLHMNRVKVNGTSKSDGRSGLVQSVPFQALLNINGGTGTNTDYTTISIQDSLAT